MSDFEQIFREKALTEQPFEGRADSWAKLDKQLDAFDTGLTRRPRIGRRPELRFWRLAAAASFAGLAWLGYQNFQASAENKVLRQELEAVKAAPLVVAPPVAAEGQSGFLEKNQPAAAESPAVANAAKPAAPASSTAPSMEKKVGSARDFYSTKNSGSFGKKATEGSVVLKKEIGRLLDSGKLPIFNNIDGGTGSDVTAATSAAIPASTAQQSAEIARLAALADSLRSVIALENRLDSVAEFPKIDGKNAPAVASQAERKVSIESKPTEQLTRPAHRAARLKLGVQAVASQDLKNIDNKTWAKGQGVAAEFLLKKGISAAASADWGTYSFATEMAEKVPHHIHQPDSLDNPNHHHNDPDHHNYEIKKVSGLQRVQNYSLGMNYTVPVGFAVRPVVRLGHTWTHFSPISTNFRYEDKPNGGPGGPDPDDPVTISKTTPASWSSNIWRVGLGLDWQRGGWVLGLSADASRDLASSNRQPDGLTLRAGLSYVF